MNRSVYLRPTSWTTIRFGIVGLLWLAGVHDAAASCGDYLLVNGVPVMEHQGDVGLHPHGEASPFGKPPAPRRCQGPSCSQSPSLPFSIPVTIQSIERVEVLAVVAANVPSGHRSIQWPLPGESAAEHKLMRDIFRPPRAAL
ncbi:MAG: hypothetical protein R3C05_04740 [Pirellulaceae bacterium]